MTHSTLAPLIGMLDLLSKRMPIPVFPGKGHGEPTVINPLPKHCLSCSIPTRYLAVNPLCYGPYCLSLRVIRLMLSERAGVG